MAVVYRRSVFIFPLILITAGLIIPAGCSFFRTERVVTVSLPELPEPMKSRFPTPGLLLQFPSAGKEEYEVACLRVEGESAQTIWEGDAGRLEIRLPKEPYVPCIAYPVTEAGMLKPAGGITDLNGSDGLGLAWEDGFTAEVLLQLFVETETYRSINIPRLVREIREKSEETGPEADSWRLDKLPILLGFGYGSFSSHRIRELETRFIELPLEPGIWFWDNPLKDSFRVPGCGLIRLEEIPLGNHILMRLAGPEYVSLHITRREWYAVYPLTEEYRSESW
jgi:hypothetical protein